MKDRAALAFSTHSTFGIGKKLLAPARMRRLCSSRNQDLLWGMRSVAEGTPMHAAIQTIDRAARKEKFSACFAAAATALENGNGRRV